VVGGCRTVAEVMEDWRVAMVSIGRQVGMRGAETGLCVGSFHADPRRGRIRSGGYVLNWRCRREIRSMLSVESPGSGSWAGWGANVGGSWRENGGVENGGLSEPCSGQFGFVLNAIKRRSQATGWC
jgi:hypothetical protein